MCLYIWTLILIPSSLSCARLKARCDGEAGGTCTRCLTSGQTCVYRNREKITLSSPDRSPTANPSIYSPQQRSLVSCNGQAQGDDLSLQADFGIQSSAFGINSPRSMDAAYQTLNHAPGIPSPLPISCKLVYVFHKAVLTDLQPIVFLTSLLSRSMVSSWTLPRITLVGRLVKQN